MKNMALALLPAALLAGCTVFPPPPQTAAPTVDGRGGVVGGDGNYFLDDRPPDGGLDIALADIPDAVAVDEPISAPHSRPYIAFGNRYVPYTTRQPYRKRGVASWYGKRYHGRPTALGEPYDMYKMTAAHPLLPLPSYARVTSVENGKSVIVRINDRGPFLRGREIDLSYVAAAKLGIVRAGTGEVVVEAIVPGAAGRASAGEGVINQVAPVDDAVYVQLAAFASESQAHAFVADLLQRLPAALAGRLDVHQKGDTLHVVQLGPYANHAAAAADDKTLCAEHGQCGFLTRRYQ